MSLQNKIAKMSTAENEITKKHIKDVKVGVSSIKDNLAKLNEELIDNDELQENWTVSPINFILSMMISNRK